MVNLDGFDVIVVGGGTAGLPTAVSAMQQGLRVLIIEKSARLGGTLWLTGGSISAAGTRRQKAKGIEDNAEQFFQDANKIGHGLADQDLLRLATFEAARGVDWLEDLGVDFGDSPQFAPEHELYALRRTHYQVERTNEGVALPLLRAMRDQIRRYTLEGQCLTLRECRVTDLLVEGGRVTGVAYETKGGVRREVRAPATVLASGGYAANRDLLKRFNPDHWRIATMTNPTSTGDGVLMAERIGAKLTHTEYINPGIGGIEDPNEPDTCFMWVLHVIGRPARECGDIWVNAEGRRFVQEDHPSNDHREKALLKQTGVMMFNIFDEPMHYGPNNLTKQWLVDIEARDVDGFNVRSAPTLEELAVKIGCEPAALVETVRRYNAAVDAGRDDEFGRQMFHGRIETPPFYALRSRGHILLTRGGVKIGTDLRVRDQEERPIPGLYAVGEVIGNGRLSGDAALGGMGVGPSFSLGRLLGTLLPEYVAEARATA